MTERIGTMVKNREKDIELGTVNSKDIEYMRLAIELARKGKGSVNPNPLVGAVVVKNDKVVGKGYHKFFGGPHAEVYSLDEAGKHSEGGIIYVTLEPCSHYGKTPPCAEKIIKMGIKKCFIGSRDPNPLVSGKGVEILKKAGVEVIEDVLKEECDLLNQIFFKYIRTKIPYLFVKCGITLDGKIALSNGISKWITNEKSREKVQYHRNRLMGIMVGINTVLTDNPSLTARIEGGRNPYRIIVDPNLKIGNEMGNPLKVLTENSDGKTIIITSEKNKDSQKLRNLKKNFNVESIFLPGREFLIGEILKKIGNMGIDSVLLEGGEKLISRAFKEKVVDGGEIFISNKIMGDEKAKPFISGFSPLKMEDVITFNKVINNIYGENIGMEFYINIYNS